MIHSTLLLLSTASAGQRIAASWPWYIIRAAGFTAAGLIVLLMLSGIGQVTGFTYRFIEPIKAWALHKAMAFAVCGAILIHVGFLLIDHFISFTPLQLLVPFLSTYSNGTTVLGVSLGFAAVAFGILAMYGVGIVVLSSLGWIDSKKSRWRKLHYLSYAVAVLVFLHAIYAGSDLKYGTFRAGWILLGLTVVVGIGLRILRSGANKSVSPSDTSNAINR